MDEKEVREEFNIEKGSHNSQNLRSTEQDNLRAALVPSFWLTQLLLLIPGVSLLWFLFLRKGYGLGNFFLWHVQEIWLWGTLVAILGMAIQFVAWRIFPLDAFDDGGVNSLLLELPVGKLFPMFLVGAFSEELLVRGVIQTTLTDKWGILVGVLLTSVLFTLMHFRYLKKPVLFSGVFVLSLIFCSLYGYTGNLWTTTWSHFLYNLGSAILAKKFYLPKLKEKQPSA